MSLFDKVMLLIWLWWFLVACGVGMLGVLAVMEIRDWWDDRHGK